VAKVTVALVGDPKSAPPGSADWSLSWVARPKVGLEVSAEETLADLLDRAAEAFQALPFSPFERPSEFVHWVAFEDDSGKSLWERRVSELTLIDEHGEVVWGVRDWAAVSYRQLQLSAAAGLLPGDATRIYFIRQIPQGGGYLGVESWRLFVELWHVADHELETLGRLAELAAGGHLAWKLLRKAIAAVERHWPRWNQHGATPGSLPNALTTTDDEELAERLGCSPAEAEAVRAFFAAISGDDALLTGIQRDIELAETHHQSGYVDYRSLFLDRVRVRTETGHDPAEADIDRYRVDTSQWYRDTFGLSDVADEQVRHWDDPYADFEHETEMGEADDDSLALVRLGIAIVIVLPGLVVAVGLDVGWMWSVVSGLVTTIAIGMVFSSRRVRGRVSTALARVLPLE
jgi:hypothetical protein